MSDDQTRVPTDRLARLHELAERLVGEYDLGGRWGWYGQYKAPYLSTRARGRQTVLALTAQSRIRTVEADGIATMATPVDVPVFEVCPEATSAADRRVYRKDIVGLRTPVADWLAEVDPETVAALIAEVLAHRAATGAAAEADTEVTAPKPVTWHEVGCPHCEALSWTACRTPLGRLRMTPHVRRVRYAATQERHPTYGLNAKNARPQVEPEAAP